MGSNAIYQTVLRADPALKEYDDANLVSNGTYLISGNHQVSNKILPAGVTLIFMGGKLTY